MSINGHLLKRKCSHSPLNLRILSSTSVPFTLTTVQVLNLALTHKKRITVHLTREAEAGDRGHAVLKGDDKHLNDLTSLESPRLVTVAVFSSRVMISL